MARYSEAFKARMVQRMTVPGGPNAEHLSRDINVPAWTLRRWLNAAAIVGDVAKKKKSPVPPVEGGSASGLGAEKDSRSSREWSPAEKLRVVAAASQVKDDELGAFLRREGLHLAQLEEWRADILTALGRPRVKLPEDKRVRELERELARKDRALAEVTALLVLEKKVQALFGSSAEEGDVMDDKNEKR